ncbi:LCP family protein [Curtobacterium sp. RRHDQ10]|uniref:LCP family protein n=1 Tax=Curtobacterium phyllosphaerae TaxID=3413379 RepID=UPI003BF3BFF6
MQYAPRHARRAHTRVVLPVIAGVLVAVVALVGGYSAYSYTRFTSGVSRIDALSKPSGTGAEDVDGRAMNILLVGDDERPADATPEELAQLSTESDGGGRNTDTIIVLHVDADGEDATMVSLPRDSWVDIPGHGKGKINSAFSLGAAGGGDSGGAQLLTQTVQTLTGLTIDHYVQVSLIKFYRIVQVLGPVHVCLNHAVEDHYSGIDLPAGPQDLNPQQAVSFVRQRHGLPNGDIDRTARQQYFLTQEAKQIVSAGTLLNPVRFTKVLDAVGSSLTTDEDLDLVHLAAQLRTLRPANIRSATIPVTFGTIGGLSVDIVDTASMPAFLQSLVGPPPAYADATAANRGEVTVRVLNASGVTGAATAATTALTALGFVGGTPGSSSAATGTVVEYPAGMEAQAKAVVAAVPGSSPVQTATVDSVTLLLGTDGVRVPAPSAPGASGAPTAGSAAGAGTAPSQPTSTVSKPGESYGTDGSCIN